MKCENLAYSRVAFVRDPMVVDGAVIDVVEDTG
jgi:hypothetical protein